MEGKKSREKSCALYINSFLQSNTRRRTTTKTCTNRQTFKGSQQTNPKEETNKTIIKVVTDSQINLP
jgi:hypothetical protein